MPGEVMTEVSAIIPADRADDVPAAFAELAQRPVPDGLLRTELLAGREGEWKIQSLWRRLPWMPCELAPNRRQRPRCSDGSARNRYCVSTTCGRATSPGPDLVPITPARGSRHPPRSAIECRAIRRVGARLSGDLRTVGRSPQSPLRPN